MGGLGVDNLLLQISGLGAVAKRIVEQEEDEQGEQNAANGPAERTEQGGTLATFAGSLRVVGRCDRCCRPCFCCRLRSGFWFHYGRFLSAITVSVNGRTQRRHHHFFMIIIRIGRKRQHRQWGSVGIGIGRFRFRFIRCRFVCFVSDGCCFSFGLIVNDHQLCMGGHGRFDGDEVFKLTHHSFADTSNGR